MTTERMRWEFAPHIERRLKRIRIGLLIFNAIAIAFYLVVVNYPIMTISQITVDGPEEWKDEARALVAPLGDSNTFTYDVRKADGILSAEFGTRADCRVRLALPGRIDIRMTPSRPVLWTEWGDGVRSDGAVFTARSDMPSAPIWRSVRSKSSAATQPPRSRIAVGTWAEIAESDARFKTGVSEWSRDDRDGWIMTAADGRTRIILGWNALEERAAWVARILEHRDSTITEGGTIDARFDGCVLVRPAGNITATGTPSQNRHVSTPAMASRRPVANNRQGG